MIRVDLNSCNSFIPLPYEAALAPRLRIAHDHLQKGDGAGSDFTGWVRLPENYDKEEFARIKAAAARIKADSQALVVIGIGGSYLVARGVQIEAWSVEDGGAGVCFNVYCYNVQPGVEIDYATGESCLAEENAA